MGLFHLNIIISNPFSASDATQFFFMTESNYIINIHSIFLILFSLDVYLVPFHISSIVNSAPISMGVQASPLYTGFSPLGDIYIEMAWIDYREVLCSNS